MVVYVRLADPLAASHCVIRSAEASQASHNVRGQSQPCKPARVRNVPAQKISRPNTITDTNISRPVIPNAVIESSASCRFSPISSYCATRRQNLSQNMM